jgi:hypothetical protein
MRTRDLIISPEEEQDETEGIHQEMNRRRTSKNALLKKMSRKRPNSLENEEPIR